jgi:hypothetical protein
MALKTKSDKKKREREREGERKKEISAAIAVQRGLDFTAKNYRAFRHD